MAVEKTVTARRIAQPGSPTWHAMLDGAEAILRDEGYGALTSRRVAEQVGVKQRLVYYYFHTMDDLIVALFRRLSERELPRLAATVSSDRPLHEIWKFCVHTSDARLILEFMALANRVEALREEVITFIETSRRYQIEALSAAIERSGTKCPLHPAALANIATSLALSITREAELGVHTGHAEAIAAVDAFLAAIE